MRSINRCYLDLIKKILRYGEKSDKDNKKILDNHDNYNNHYYIHDPLNLKFRAKYQNITSKSMLDDIKAGNFNIESNPIKSDDLYKYIKSFKDSDDQDFIDTHFHSNRVLQPYYVNQIKYVKQDILDRIGQPILSINSTISVKHLYHQYDKYDIPSLQRIQPSVRGNSLTIDCFFHSDDIYNAFYSNMFFITYIGIRLTEEINKELSNRKIIFGGIYYNSTSSYIHYNDLEAAKKLISIN